MSLGKIYEYQRNMEHNRQQFWTRFFPELRAKIRKLESAERIQASVDEIEEDIMFDSEHSSQLEQLFRSATEVEKLHWSQKT